ncbi:MAG: Nif3-like dinuclear metal center hexameric protein [Salibacteraceae bacterium]
MAVIKDVVSYLEGIAPSRLQESYDNAGLIVGEYNTEVTGVLICLDSIEATIDEALKLGANLIVAHHPIVFKGLKRFNGNNYVERTVIKAIKNDIAIFAIHTNIDSVINGVSAKIAEKLGVENLSVLSQKETDMMKLETYVPVNKTNEVLAALFKAGAGTEGGYSNCSFASEGRGSFIPMEGSNPYVGDVGKIHQERETKLEVTFSSGLKSKVINSLIKAHPYEEVAYNVFKLENVSTREGLGVIGVLPEKVEAKEFLARIKTKMKAGVVRYTQSNKSHVKRIAICGGSGSFLLSAAKKAKADLFLTADFKYHEFFDSENELVIADIGHYESEQYTSELLYDLLTQKFSTFAIRISAINTNPVNYL